VLICKVMMRVGVGRRIEIPLSRGGGKKGLGKGKGKQKLLPKENEQSLG
jgi:hypothetical protein